MTEQIQTAAARLTAGHRLTDKDIAALAETRDILTLGMLADEARRLRHGADTTFVRVAEVRVPLDDGVRFDIPTAAREVRISGQPDSLTTLILHVRRVVAAARGIPVSAFSLRGRSRPRRPSADGGWAICSPPCATRESIRSPRPRWTSCRTPSMRSS